jgi:hypothetical protein
MGDGGWLVRVNLYLTIMIWALQQNL